MNSTINNISLDESEEDLDYESSDIQILINVFFLPIVSFIGFLLNLLCAFVYRNILKTQPENKMYNYLIVNSVSNSIAMLIDSFAPVALCGNSCNISHTYAAQVFYLYGFIYLADVFETFSSLIDIVITIDRYVTINNRMKFLKKINHKKIITTVFIFCFIYYIPFIAKKRISSIAKPLKETTKSQNLGSKIFSYITISSEFGKSDFGKYFIFIQIAISEVLLLCIMIGFNVQLAYSLKRKNHIKHVSEQLSLSRSCDIGDNCNEALNDGGKKHSIAPKNCDLKVTMMVISLSILTLLGNTPVIIVHTMTFFYNINHTIANTLLALSNLFTVISYALIIIVYYVFDMIFRHTLKQMMRNKLTDLLAKLFQSIYHRCFTKVDNTIC